MSILDRLASKLGYVKDACAVPMEREAAPTQSMNKSKQSGTETRTLPPNVCQVEVNGPLTVTVTRGDAAQVTISCNDSEVLSKVKTDICGDAVRIGFKAQSFISGSGRSSIQISGHGNIVIGGSVRSGDFNGMLISDDLDLKISIVLPKVTDLKIEGSGDIIFLEADQPLLTVDIAGSGDIVLGGKVENFSASVAGSGDVKAVKLKAQNAKLQVAGSGDIDAYVVQSVDARVMGSGDICIHGNPTTKKTKVVGSGDIDFA